MRNHVTVEQWMAKFDVDRATAVWMLKAIADRGVATFKAGRKGWPSRLERA